MAVISDLAGVSGSGTTGSGPTSWPGCSSIGSIDCLPHSHAVGIRYLSTSFYCTNVTAKEAHRPGIVEKKTGDLEGSPVFIMRNSSRFTRGHVSGIVVQRELHRNGTQANLGG